MSVSNRKNRLDPPDTGSTDMNRRTPGPGTSQAPGPILCPLSLREGLVSRPGSLGSLFVSRQLEQNTRGLWASRPTGAEQRQPCTGTTRAAATANDRPTEHNQRLLRKLPSPPLRMMMKPELSLKTPWCSRGRE
jgi:hypothetical protein